MSQRDEIIKELTSIVDNSFVGNVIDRNILILKLVVYMTKRDWRIYDHAYQKGRYDSEILKEASTKAEA